MPLSELHHYLALGLCGLGVVTFISLLVLTAPYGRHARPGWGPTVSARTGWLIMESPAVFAFLAFYAVGTHRAETVPLVLLALWQLHYVNRTLIYPFRLRSAGRPMPLSIAAMGASFNVLNAWLNATQISELGSYPAAWLADPRFLAGAALFLIGFTLNVRADNVLLALRAPGQTGYRVPHGALHDHVAAPNYFGELLEWGGFALATWSLAGLAFFVYTAANLVPRALSNLRWYRAQFPDYPRTRKAIIPFVL